MTFLLPHRFKKLGAVIAPIGLVLWFSMQWGVVPRILSFVFGESTGGQNSSPYYLAHVIVTIISFFSFLGGVYFVTFSKEKIEDEMVQRTRLDSFQFAALVQIVFIIIGFLAMVLFKDPGMEGLMLFFIGVIFLFWLCFIGRFNYILHIKIK